MVRGAVTRNASNTQPTSDAIDTGSNKSALLACNKLLKKYPKNDLLKVCSQRVHVGDRAHSPVGFESSCSCTLSKSGGVFSSLR